MPLEPVSESYKKSTLIPSDSHRINEQKQHYPVWSTPSCSSGLAFGDSISFPKIKSTLKRPNFYTTESLRISPEVSSRKCGSKWWEPQNPTGINAWPPKGQHLFLCLKNKATTQFSWVNFKVLTAMLSHISLVWLLVSLWASQAPLSMGFSGQEY